MLCPGCRASLSGRPAIAWPTPVPAGLVTPWASESYDGAVRALVVGHKDRGQWGHRRVLADLLAASVMGACADLDPAVPLLLVPVPSRPGAGRQRGYEATAALVRAAAARVRRHRPVLVAPLVVSRGAADQAGLDAAGRAANVHRSMHCPSSALARVARRRRPAVRRGLRRRASRPGPPRGRPSGRSRRSGCRPWRSRRSPPRAGLDCLLAADVRGASVVSWSPSGSVVASRRGLLCGKPMPVAGETVHVSPSQDDHGAA